MNRNNPLFKIWEFLNADTWQSWIVTLIIVIVGIKFVFFPLLSLITGSPLPLVVVESCSMYHESSFDNWWESNKEWYIGQGISKNNFLEFPLKNGLNKGDIVIVTGYGARDIGDIIIFNSETRYPLIHRIISLNPIQTNGDHNPDQLPLEKNISNDAVLGKAVAKIPLLGWIKLIFFDFQKPENQRGFC